VAIIIGVAKYFAKTVELLLASRTVGGTVESQLQLRRFTVVGIHLMLLWMLSPLGGQACLRALERTEHVTRNPLALRYLYTGPYAAHLTTKSVNSFDGDLYYALLQAPPKMKAAPHDNWGNVRVPRLEALLTSAAGRRRREEDWLPVTDVETPEQHSSLLGMPVVGLPARNASVVVSFMMYAAYMSLACSSWDTFAESDERLEYYKRISRGGDPLRGGMLGNSSLSPTEHNTTFFLDGDVPGGTLRNASALARDPRPRTVFFVSARRAAEEAEFDMSAIRCVVSETRVEVAVECPESRDCHATRMRRSKPQSPLVDHSTPLDNAALMLNAMTNLPLMYRTDGNASSPVEAFLRNSRKLLMNTYSAPYVNLSEVPPATFAQRLSLVLNAWYQLSLVGYAGVFYGDNPTNLAAYGYDFGQLAATNGSVPQTVVNESCDLMCTRSTQASVTHTVEAFAYSCPWLALLFACSVVMLAMGLAGSVLSVRTSVPDLLGYAASMTYNNRYLPLPNDSGGVLDAMHRARLMYDLPVSVRDVKSFGEVGRIGFTSLANGRPLEKGRRYT
jgi:hypothetical protein